MNVKAIKSNIRHDCLCFQRMRNKVNAEFKQAKELFYKNKFSKSGGDPRKTWQVIDKTGRSYVKELSLNRVSITNLTSLSNAVNDHFPTIGPKLAREIPLNNGPSFQGYIFGLRERFHFVSTDSNQVLSLFLKKKTK